jgi:phage/plasmid-associated DNA primase
MDRWDVMMYIIGMAGSGKSTFVNHVLKKIYQETDIGVLDNNIEEQFGLYNIVKTGEKFITIGVELDHTFKLKRTDFLKMVSGDDLMIAVKGGIGFTYLWPSHIICIGNKLFGFEDNKGELARRIVPFWYDYKVRPGDTDVNLDEKLFQELPNIIQKFTKAYLWASQKHGNKNVWCVLPEYFQETKMKISEQTNAVQAFLSSNEITFGKDSYCLESVFRQRFMDFCKSRGLGHPKLTGEIYKGVLQDASENKGYPIFYEPMANKLYPLVGGFMRRKEAFVMGLDVTNRDLFDKNAEGDNM